MLDITKYQRASFRKIWNNGQYLQLLEHIMELDDQCNGVNRHTEPGCQSHIGGCDCMYDECIDNLQRLFYDGDKFKFSKNSLEWLFIPHDCSIYVLIEWICLIHALPNNKIDILYYVDHFVCIDQQQKKVYDLLYDIYNDNGCICCTFEDIRKSQSSFVIINHVMIDKTINTIINSSYEHIDNVLYDVVHKNQLPIIDL